MTFKIYDKEFELGLAEKIEVDTCLAYTSSVLPFKPTEDDTAFAQKICANAVNRDNWDLFFMSSVLASAGWNKNNDVFLAEEIHAARNSPVNKMLNFMHNENDIIGHMIASKVVDEKGDEVVNASDSHDAIVNSVIYAKWEDEDNQERISNLISEIESGDWFVSMECRFKNFDYAVTAMSGEKHLIKRDEDSAFLSAHLIQYGGSGEYQGYKIGRALRNFTFSGVGIVDNPANERSIIFNDVISFASAGCEEIKNTELTETNPMSDQVIASLREDLAKAEARNEKLEANLDEMKAQAQEDARKKYESAIAGLKVDIEDKDSAITNKDQELVEKDQVVADLQKKLQEVESSLASANKEIASAKAEAVASARKAQLVEAGVPADEVDEVVKTWASADDAQFDNIVELHSAKYSKMEEDKKDDKKKEDKKAEAADESSDDNESTVADLDDAKSDDDFDGVVAHDQNGVVESAKAWFTNVLSEKGDK